MKTLMIGLAATTAITLAASAASAQSWIPIDQRQDRLDARIDAGVRSGDLTRREAASLRSQFTAIASLEDRYRTNGLSWTERRDLDRRFDALSASIRVERNDWQERNWYGGRNWTDNRGHWVSMNQRKAQLDRRIDQGVRSGQLTRPEAARLIGRFDAISNLERRYRADGLSRREMADLNQRFDELAAQIRVQRRDDERVYGYNR